MATPDHATPTRSLFQLKEEGKVSVDREHPMAGVVLSIFPHAEVGSRNDDPISTMEANEALGLSLAFMVPATGREAQLTRATSQSGGMRKFKMPLDKINAVMVHGCRR